MSGGHGDQDAESIAARDSWVHRLDPRVKIVGLIGLAIVSVSTPPGAWAAFAAYAAVLALLVALARLPLRHVGQSMTVEVPFLLAAAVLPFTVPNGVELGATVAAKATIGLLAMVVLSSTTPFPRLLHGFEQLHAPRTITLIVALMWRYLQVLGGEVHRMRVARDARGYHGRWLWQAGPVAALIATLFLRALERGERVYLAMLSRGYRGGMPAALQPSRPLRVADAVFAGLLAGSLGAGRLVLA